MKLLITNGEKGVLRDEADIKGSDRQALIEEIASKGVKVDTLKKRLLLSEAAKKVSIKPFELKQHFISKGEFDNADKVERLKMDSPTKAVGTIKTEMTFFGKSFLEGFLGVYGIKMNSALAEYENKMIMVPELNVDRWERTFNTYRVNEARLQQTAKFQTKQEAEEMLVQENTVRREKTIKISGGLTHEIPQTD